MRRRNYGEPLPGDLYGDVDQVDDEDEPLEREFDRVGLGQAFRDVLTLGRIGLALHRATAEQPPPSSPGMIDMVEISPGVFARRPTDRPRQQNPISRIAHIHRAFAVLRKEIR